MLMQDHVLKSVETKRLIAIYMTQNANPDSYNNKD